MTRRFAAHVLIFLCSAIVLTGAAAPAVAHPHIFVDAKAKVVFDDSGALVAIHHEWTFDEAFSVWQVQGLDENEDGVTSSGEMQELADENLAGLAEYQFYTFAGAGRESLAFVAAGRPRYVFENNRSTYFFSVAPASPYAIRDSLEIAINDPEYYVAITFGDPSSVTLENAPAGCEAELLPPEPMDDVLAAQLYALPPEVTELPPELASAMRGVQGAIIVTCPPGASRAGASAATEAAADVADASSALPFGGPPPEPGLVMPRTGILGWIAEQQRIFYQSLTGALASLQRDGNAFWLLGSLSFLYGVFHAAGPGHGKVVISSYMLANESQVRRGIVLSFAAAMLQSAVAIGFVLVAAAALNLTAAAMDAAANAIGVVSYALVALLGLWLIARKLLGEGHRHGAVHDHHGDAHDHAHERDRGIGHHHAVTPMQTAGGWREQLGVVLAVGLRPCSGALVVLAFALSQGLFAAGIVAVLLMGLGTALTIAVLAGIAVGAKGFAHRLAGTNLLVAGGILWWAELLGALLVFGFGVLLLLASI